MDEGDVTCSLCKTEFHYMDTLIINGERVCIECCSSELVRMRAEIERQRRTIRALVVAARAMWRYIAYIQKWLGSPKSIAVTTIMQEIACTPDRRAGKE